jgi:hypothetical protein
VNVNLAGKKLESAEDETEFLGLCDVLCCFASPVPSAHKFYAPQSASLPTAFPLKSQVTTAQVVIAIVSRSHMENLFLVLWQKLLFIEAQRVKCAMMIGQNQTAHS